MNNFRWLKKSFKKKNVQKFLNTFSKKKTTNRTGSMLSLLSLGAMATYFSMNRNQKEQSTKTIQRAVESLQHSAAPLSKVMTELGEELTPKKQSFEKKSNATPHQTNQNNQKQP